MSRRVVHSLLFLASFATLVRAALKTDLPDHRFFLQEIFNKYGDRGVMSFEGFEHLLDSLGLGRLEFQKEHNVSVHRVNGTFAEMHDVLELHTHNHSHQKREAEFEEELGQLVSEHQEIISSPQKLSPKSTVCLSPQDILVTYGLQPNHEAVISPIRFLHLCPAIVYELDQRTCYTSYVEDEYSSDKQDFTRKTKWLYAGLSILIMSVTGFLIVFLVPVMSSLSCYNHILHFLVALAVGTLCGDAFLHLLPHAMMTDNPLNTAEVVPKVAATFAALISFFALESTLNLIKHQVMDKSENGGQQKEKFNDKEFQEGHAMESVVTVQPKEEHSHGHHHHSNGSKSVAFMVMLGDAVHNVTDGLAIGAAFSGDIVAGIATSVAVFCHELPHELGDFAVLIKSGVSIRRALSFNVFSSVLSIIGMVTGVFLGNIDNSTQWIYAVTAGIFLYIALCDLVPEMNHYSEGSASCVNTVLQLSGISLGGVIMVTIALYEDTLHEIFSQSS